MLFVVRSLTYRNPVVDLRALGNRNFALGCVLSFITGIGIFTTIYLTPLFLGYVRGFSAWQTGVAIFSTGVASMVGVPVYIMLARKFDLRWLMMFGLASFGLAMWSYSFITHDWGAGQLLLPQMLARLPAGVRGGAERHPGPRQPAARAAEIRQRAVQHDAQPGRRGRHRGQRGDHQRPDEPAFPDDRRAPDAGERRDGAVSCRPLTERYGALPGSPGAGHDAALKQLWALAYREASTLAFADAFRAIMLAFVVATLLVPLLRKVAAPTSPQTESH